MNLQAPIMTKGRAGACSSADAELSRIRERAPAKLIALTLLLLAFLLAASWQIARYGGLQLQDFPNHLARAYILLHSGTPAFRRFYRIDFSPIPDLGWDLWALAFGRVISLAAAAKLLIFVEFAVGISGCLALGRAFTGRWSVLPLIASPFFLNGAYTKGFLSFDLGVSVSLWAMVWWIVLRPRPGIRFAGATVFATMLYLTHLYAFGVYGVFVLGFEIHEFWNGDRRFRPFFGRLFLNAMQAAPSILLLYASAVSIRSLDGGVLYDSPLARLGDLAMLIDLGRDWSHGVFVLAYVLAIGFALKSGWLRIADEARPALALYVAAFLLLPGGLFETNYVAWRVMLAFVLVGISSLSVGSRPQRLFVPAMLIAAITMMVGYDWLHDPSWARSEREKQDFLSAIAPLKRGARIFFAHDGSLGERLTETEDGAYHVASYAVLAKDDLVQSLFVYPGQQVLRFRDPAFQNAPRNSETMLPDIAENFALAGQSLSQYVIGFDYVILHGHAPALERRVLPMQRLRRIETVGEYRVFEVSHAPSGP